jgi:sphinganine C4-monooxygenase
MATMSTLPPLPEYTLTPQAPLLSFIPDKYLSVVLPVIAYWAFSMAWHYIDTHDYLAKYRLHTPAEVLKRNHVPLYEVIRDVLIQHFIQTIMGCVLGFTEPDDFVGKDDYNVAVWAQRIRVAQQALPWILSIAGVNSSVLSNKVNGSHPMLAGALAGGIYPSLKNVMTLAGDLVTVPAFASWEITVAKALYWVLVPAFQFWLAVFVMDTWQYFLHRAMHMNQFLYREYHLAK